MPLDTSSLEDIISEKKSLRLAKISLNYENDALPLFYTHGALVLRYMMCTEE